VLGGRDLGRGGSRDLEALAPGIRWGGVSGMAGGGMPAWVGRRV